MKTTLLTFAVLLFCSIGNSAHALLAGFEVVDGYAGPFFQDNWSYDAGQTGASFLPAQYNTGRFHELLGSGSPSDSQYVSQHFISGGFAMAVRSNVLSTDGTYNMSTQYDVGSDDLGIAPTTALSSATIDFDICPGRTSDLTNGFDTIFNNVPAFSLNVGGTNTSPGLTIGFTDHDPGDSNRPQMFHVNGAATNTQTVNWSTQRFDHIQIAIDYSNQTYDLYWTKDSNLATLGFDAGNVPQLIASGAAFSSAMSSLDSLYFKAHQDPSDGVTPKGLDKSYLDNFQFSVTPVPEPSAAILVLLGGIGLLGARRPRKTREQKNRRANGHGCLNRDRT